MADPQAGVSDATAQDKPAAYDSAQSRDLVPSGSIPFDAYQSLVRLLIGGAIEGADAAIQRVRTWEAGYSTDPGRGPLVSDETFHDLVRYAVVGLLVDTSEATRSGASFAARATLAVGRLGLLPVRVAATSETLAPVRRGLGRFVPDPTLLIGRWTDLGRDEERHGRGLARRAVTDTIDEVVDYLARNPEVAHLVDEQVVALLPKLAHDPLLDRLIEQVAGRYLVYLQDHPEEIDGLVVELAGNYLHYLQEKPEEVQPLIRSQGDEYIGYLNENPDQVQTLIQGQSLGLTAEIVDEVRERGVTADTLLEYIARRIARRQPRSELPGAPDEVRQRAARYREPNDEDTFAETDESGDA